MDTHTYMYESFGFLLFTTGYKRYTNSILFPLSLRHIKSIIVLSSYRWLNLYATIIHTLYNKITTFLILIFASPKEVKDPNIHSASTSSTSSFRHAAYTKGLSIFVNLHVRIYTGFFLVALSLLVYAVSVPSVGVAIAMGYVMGIGDATAQSGIYVSCCSCVCVNPSLLLYV